MALDRMKSPNQVKQLKRETSSNRMTTGVNADLKYEFGSSMKKRDLTPHSKHLSNFKDSLRNIKNKDSFNPDRKTVDKSKNSPTIKVEIDRT
jgi:hypothetical protein